MLLFDFLDTANARAYDNTNPKGVFFGEIKAAVIDGLDGRGDGKLAKAVHSLCFAMVNIFFYVEALHLTAEPYGVGTGIEELYVRYAAFTLAQRSEKLVSGLGQGGDAT